MKAEWVLYIQLDKIKEAEIQSCFNCDIEFHYLRDKERFDNLLEDFKLCSKNSSNSVYTSSLNSSNYGENIKRDRVIVMDDVTGLADTLQKKVF